ncbi:transcriptional activator NhaR [Nitrospira defluvii]|uniref:Transcriptional activator protein, LysR family n=1 Tax=Nitrospira defluvii TaxID=330214 RepID=A0ABM8R8W7_9BACT|nr:transcriptional activator NhaR [Nitrospira defluvii]CAE6739720.1 Transcriptional activator protein, LysR family [Nitrospira defluvii]
MEWLNYHHLLYFWSVAKHGSVRKACEELRLAQPTISAQIRVLEEALGERLFARSGRHLILTEMGRVVFGYAEDIFSLGQDLMNTVKGRSGGRSMRLTVGIADAVPKLLATRILKPAFTLSYLARIVCLEGTLDRLLADLAIHRLDLVIGDTQAPSTVNVQAYSHLMGESTITLFATAKLATRYRRNFPQSLEGAPFLLPTSHATLRRLLDTWLVRKELHPNIIGEFEDSATLKAIGHDGYGIFPGSTVMEKEICRQYQVRMLGRVDGVKQRFYAITVERKLEHPAVRTIFEAARRELLT